MEIAFLLTNVKINVKRNTQEEHKQKIHKNLEKVILNTMCVSNYAVFKRTILPVGKSVDKLNGVLIVKGTSSDLKKI